MRYFCVILSKGMIFKGYTIVKIQSLMNKNQPKGEYLAPNVKVVETRSRGVLCASGSNETYNEDTWQWS